MKPRIIIFIISLIALAIFYGCGSHSSNALFVNPQNDVVITSKETIIDKLGRLPSVTFPSGAKFEALSENTLTPGIKVQLIEQKITSKNIGYFSNSSSFSCSFIYGINAFQSSTNLPDSKVYVTTVEKPFKVTLPKTQNKQGVVFVGIKESDTNPWRFFSLSDSSEILAKISNIRLSEISPNEYTFEIFRLGTQLALVTCDDNINVRLPETIVSNLNASSTSYILIKDGKYLDDLTLKCIFKGLKLNSIKPSDFRARITYRNNIAKTSIKVNGANVVQTNKADNTVPGYSYVHSFEIDSLSDFNLMSNDGEVAFILNLKGFEIQSFPSGFLIEFFNKVNSEKILPYSYTEFYTLNKAESVNLALISSDGNLADETDNFYILNPTFSVTSSYDFGDIDKEKIAKAISVSNVDSEKISKVWNDKTLTLSFNENLENETLYTISIAEVNDIEGFSITTFEDFTFTTRPENKIEVYNIEYDYNGGNVETQNPTTYDLGSATFTLNNPTKEGYEFIGWTNEEIVIPQMMVTIEKGSTGDKTYTANYKAINYPIIYVLNEGNVETTNPESYDICSETIILNNPTKEGFTFVGWTSEDITTPQKIVIIEKGSTGSKTFTANWSLFSYKVTLNKGKGIAEVSGDGVYEYGSQVIASCTMLEGYEFDFWTGNNTEPNFTMPNNDVVMQANAKPINYSIECDLKEGNVSTNNINSYNIDSDNITLINPTRLGYTFTGWTGTDLDSASMTLSIPQGSIGNRAYTANWVLATYTITYNVGDGNVESPNFTTYYITSENIILNNPVSTRDYYLFKGWSGTELEGNENLVVTIPQGSVGDREYTANYAPESFQINYEYDGVMSENPESYDITTLSFLLNNPTKEGYDFLGWEGTDIPIGTASKTVIIYKGSVGQRNYVASYTKRYTIDYDLTGGSILASNPDSYNIYTDNIILNNPTKENCDFLGWTGTDIPEGTASKTVVIYKGSEGNRQYIASFTEKYTITYNLNGGTTSNPLSYNKHTNTFTLTTPTRTGETSADFYVFLGWSGTDLASITTTVTIPQGSTGNREFTAHWREGKSFELSPGISLDLVKCPAGTFFMGSPAEELERGVNESQHKVTLSQDFYMGVYEVTQEQYFAVMGTNPSNFKDNPADEKPTTSANQPVETVKWADAKNFCAWLNTNITSGVPADYHFDLPTEAQWEYACRAGTTTTLNNGTNVINPTLSTYDQNLNEVAWFKSISLNTTHPVGEKKPNNWGLYDMHGNIQEWCLDKRSSNWETDDYPTAPVIDPVKTTGDQYIIRGGDYQSTPNKRYRSAARDGKGTSSSFNYVGFRVVLTHD